MPADCLLIEGNDIEVDEKFFSEKERAPKATVEEGNHHGKDPFLYSGSIMLKGSGKALACVVGL